MNCFLPELQTRVSFSHRQGLFIAQAKNTGKIVAVECGFHALRPLHKLGLYDPHLRRRTVPFTNASYLRLHFFLARAFKSTVLTGVDFFSHLVAEDRARRGQPYESSPAHLRVKSIDLAAMLFKSQYLDRKNLTFIVRRYERGRRLAPGRRRPGNRPQGANSMVAADGALARSSPGR